MYIYEIENVILSKQTLCHANLNLFQGLGDSRDGLPTPLRPTNSTPVLIVSLRDVDPSNFGDLLIDGPDDLNLLEGQYVFENLEATFEGIAVPEAEQVRSQNELERIQNLPHFLPLNKITF